MKYTWLVEKYLEGELSGEALQKFEMEILRNPEAAKELERIRKLHAFMEDQHIRMSRSGELIEDYEDLENVVPEHELADELEGLKIRRVHSDIKGLHSFRTRLAEVEASRTLQQRRSSKILVGKFSVWLAAASIAIIIIASGILITDSRRTPDYQALYEQFYAPETVDISLRNGSSPEQRLFDEALGLYSEKRYAEALEYFNRISEPVSNPVYHLYKGITMMELGRHHEAISLFSHLDHEPLLNQYGMWYTGLCYLTLEQVESARRVFTKIAEGNGYYMKQCKALLRKI